MNYFPVKESFKTPLTLTVIYNLDEKDFQQENKRIRIGFKAINTN